MDLNPVGLLLIKKEESCRLHAYKDNRPKTPRWTIGWGYAGKEVQEGLVWTQEQADKILIQTVEEIQENLRKIVKGPMNLNQEAALISLIYNIGIGHFITSTILRKFNQGLFDEAACHFAEWCHSDGVVNDVLVGRRDREKVLFLTPSTVISVAERRSNV